MYAKYIKRTAFVGIVLMSLLSLFYVVSIANDFSDIIGQWYEDTVTNAVSKGWIKGYEDGTFKGDNDITRAEFVAVINRMLDNTTSSTKNMFTDVASNDWYYEDILKAINLGIINGYEDGTFKPNDNITREDAILVISRLNGLENATSNLIPSDINSASDYAREAVFKLYNLRIVRGDENGKINPHNNITRAEAVTIIERTYNTINNLLPQYVEPNFEIKQNTSGFYYIYATNAYDLYEYKFYITYSTPIELNSFKYVKAFSGETSINYLEEKYFSSVDTFTKDFGVFLIDSWNYYNEYQGYVPNKGEKITMEVVVVAPSGISKTYYIDYVVE